MKFNIKGVVGITIINVIMFVITLGGFLFSDSLGNFWVYTFVNHEYYRLFTCMFVHAGISHLVCNTIALFQYGILVENAYGTKKFILFYILCGLGASVGSALINMILGRSVISVGASGAICGLLGIIIADLKGSKKGKVINILCGLVPLFIIGISSGVDNIAHFSGVFTGYIIGRIFKSKYEKY